MGKKRFRLAVTRVLAVLVVGGLGIFGNAALASAHSGDQSYLYLTVGESSLTGRVEMPYADMREVFDLDLDPDSADGEIEAELVANSELISAYLRQHLSVGPDSSPWPIAFSEPERFFSDEPEVDPDYAVVGLDIDIDGEVPRNFPIRFDAFFEEIPDRSHLLLIENDVEGGVVGNGWESLASFNADDPVVDADLGNASWFKNFWASIKLGVEHIQTGPDHVLFVLVLLLPSVLVWRDRQWRPVDSFTAALWRILKIVTMFTVAHSITFTLAGLGLLKVPDSWLQYVEAVIAISIAAAALHNLRPLVANREWLISFVFGLFHGVGFASLVSEMDISRSTQLVSLAGRNIGIEIGQAVVVLVLFPMLFLLRRLAAYRLIFVITSLLLTLVALGWTLERAFDLDFGTDGVVDPFFNYPEVFIVVALLTGMAALAYKRASDAGTLVETASMSVDLSSGAGSDVDDVVTV